MQVSVPRSTEEKGLYSKVNLPTKQANKILNPRYKEDPNENFLATEWQGTKTVKVVQRPAPDITEADDIIVKIIATCVCGSDLHIYFNQVPGSDVINKGDILGHEAVGIVHKVGPNVKIHKVGDKVVIPFVICCMNCEFCDKEQYSLCDNTNPSSQMEPLYGHRLAGAFGYTNLTGGFPGLHAEMARVPLADNCAFNVTGSKLSDKQLLTLSDILCTGFHATELSNIQPGNNVAIWGCGPVGLMATLCAIKLKKAGRVLVIDNKPWRLEMAARLGAETLNFDEFKSVPEEINKLMPMGPDCCIETAGFRYVKSNTQKLQLVTHLATDNSDILNEILLSCKKGGYIAIIGDYFGFCNNFNIGALMEKHLHVTGGQSFPQKYWKYLKQQMEDGIIDPSFVFSHTYRLEDIDKAYNDFGHANSQNQLIKPLITTKYTGKL